jgi:hypothetical protein
VSEADLEFSNGAFTVKGSPDRSMGIKDVAFQAHAAHDLAGARTSSALAPS